MVTVCNIGNFDHFDRYNHSVVVNITPLPLYQNKMVLNRLTYFQSTFCYKRQLFWAIISFANL